MTTNRSDDEAGKDEPVDRAAVIREYLASGARGVAVVDAYAARLGMGRSSFYRLVKSFGKEAERLLEKKSRQGTYRLDERVQRKIEVVLERLGPNCRVSDAHTLIADACRKADLPVPSRVAVNRRVIARRQTRPELLAGPEIQIDQTGLDLPVMVSGSATKPSLVLAVHLPSRKVLGHRLDAGRSSHALERVREAVAKELQIDPRLIQPTLRQGRVPRIAFGNRLGPIKLQAYQAGKSAQPNSKRSFSLQEARDLIAVLIERHNAGLD